MLKEKRDTVYKLDGKSREYAATIAAYLRAPLQNFDANKEHVKAALEGLGVSSFVTRVKHYYEGFPRAYLARPMVCCGNAARGEYYMYAPVGYNGAVFKPEEAIELSEEQAKIIGYGLFAGGWSDPEYILLHKDHGIKTPEDYNPETAVHYTINSGIEKPDCRHAFFAQTDNKSVFSLLDSENQLVGLYNFHGNRIATNLANHAIRANIQEPVIHETDRGPVLVYRCDNPETLSFCPEGFKRISAAEYQWSEADRGDMNIGITPPPPPPPASKIITGDSCKLLPP